MIRVAEDIAAGAGAGDPEQVRQLLADTMALAERCVLDPEADLGVGSVHLPEPAVLGLRPDQDPDAVLRARCEGSVATRYPGRSERELRAVAGRLADELGVVGQLGYPTYFLTVAAVCDLIRDLGVRVAARGSGAGSLVNYLLGISGVDPMEHDLLMERFCSPLRAQLPDIDVDVESARRTEVYEQVLARFGGERVTCVSMMDTYRVRHAIRDVGAALGHAAGGDRRDRQGVPAHPGPRRPQRHRRAARAAGQRAVGTPARPALRAGRAARRTAPARRAAPVRRACSPTARCWTARRSRRAGPASR